MSDFDDQTPRLPLPGPVPRVAPVPAAPASAPMFTRADLEQIAASQGVPVKGLTNRWIISNKQATGYWVIGAEGEYRRPIGRGALDVSLPRDLIRVPPAPADSTDTPPEGMFSFDKLSREMSVKRTVDEVLRIHATVAREVEATMAVTHSYYNAYNETFYERICPERRDIFPQFSAEIDEWLTYLGGSEDGASKLKDWIACLPRLDRAVCALYLYGPKETGKTLLANGLARIWSAGPSPLASAVSSFNSIVGENPLLFGDEELPKEMTSGILRQMVGADSHSFRRKNLPESKLQGNFRIIIAANEPDLLKFDGEDLTSESIAAIASRILYIKNSPDAATYLKALGGRPSGTSDWVSGDRIARHALWLAQNRVVEEGTRFLVEGRGADMPKLIARAGNIRPLVVEWIAKAIFKQWGPTKKSEGRGIQFGDGRLYVNASFVRDTWKDVLVDVYDIPSLTKIGKAIKPLVKPDADGRIEKRMRLGDHRADFYSIDPDHVYNFSRETQTWTVERFREAIEAKRAFLEIAGDEGDGVRERTVRDADSESDDGPEYDRTLGLFSLVGGLAASGTRDKGD